LIGEVDIGGVFVAPLLTWAILALVLHAVLRQGLLRFGFYRRVWHPRLADLALFVIILGAMGLFLPGVIGS
jgi:hypothetical protein